MEENSEVHMETDVSSTTDDVPESQQVTESHHNVETIIVVETLEDDGSKEQPQGTISSATGSAEASPRKAAILQTTPINSPAKAAILQTTPRKAAILQTTPINSPAKAEILQTTPKNSPVKECNASQPLLKSPINKCEPQIVLNKSSPVSISPKASPVKQQAESSDSSLNSETKTSIECLEPTAERSPLKITQPPKVAMKSLLNENISVTKAELKVNYIPEENGNDIIVQEKPVINCHDEPDSDTSIETTTNKDEVLFETSSSEVNSLEEKVSKDSTLQENSHPIEKSIEPICNVEVMVAESSNKEINSLNQSSLDNILQDWVTISPTKDACALDSSNTIIKDVIQNISSKQATSTVNGDKTICSTAIPQNVTHEEDSLLNDSLGSEVLEKDHNKSISRELKSLINSAKESKIISECTQLTTKTRKSRSQCDPSNTILNASIEPEKVGATRRSSNHSQVSNSSEKSDRGALKRSMRSQNPDFVNKCKQFLNSVTSKVMKDSDEAMSEDELNTNSKQKVVSEPDTSTSAKKKKVSDQPVVTNNKLKKMRSDAYCWRCHWIVEQGESPQCTVTVHSTRVECTVCPRSYHYRCLSTNERKISTEKNWVCPDCLQILHAEGSDTRSPAMKKTSLGMLCDLLKYALERMMDLNGVEPFMRPVDRTTFPDYDKYVIHPMDLTQMKQNIADGVYGSTDAFIADAQWILHNSIIFNTCEQAFLQSKLTGGARALVRCCRAEMGEIEACPECYASAHARKPTWFTDVCTTPHILLWAKLKGFPYWPAKGMTVNSSGLVDVRFFGAHDRAWVPPRDCFLFSEKDPNNFRSKRQDILESMQEAEQHIRNISRKYGKFVYPPFKTQFDPSKLTEQIKMMIPSFQGEIKSPIKDKPVSASPLTAKVKRRSNSKGSKSSTYDGDGSESEDTSASTRTETPKHKATASEKFTKEDTPIILSQVAETISTRKRRRSNLEEAVMTVIETSAPEAKKRKTDNTEQKKPEQQEPSSSKEEKAKSKTKNEVAELTSKKKADTVKSKSKDEEPSSSTTVEKESLRVTPIKLVALPRPNKQTPKLFTTTKVTSKPSTPNGDEKTPQRPKSTRIEKSLTGEKVKEDKAKSLKRRSSKTNKSLNTTTTPKTSKTAEKKTDNDNEATSKDLKPKEDKKKEIKESQSEVNKSTVESTSSKDTESTKNTRDRLQFDDDLSLAVLARKSRHPNAGWPTISNVVSLSASPQPEATNITPSPNSSAQNIEVTVEASSDSSVFTPTSTDSVRNMKEAVNKLQKLREETNATEPVVGRVGVRAFARMTSPERAKSVEIEIKAEPVDLEEIDADRHSEKMDLMTACKLRPVGQASSLRDVRINRVVSGGSSRSVRVGGVESRSRARKTFPTPRRADGATSGPRSELTVKNSMVYIPIQPPTTQPPPRPLKPPAQRPAAPQVTGNNTVNTVVTPLKPTSNLSCPSSSTTVTSLPTAGQVVVPTVGQVPTTVHTVPLMTSVNGQWMFSLQPVMSVGGVDNSTSSPMVNGLADRLNTTPTIVPLTATATPNSAPSTPVQPNRTANDNNTPEMPRLQQRPPLQHPFDPKSPSGPPPPPSTAGPLSAKLNQNAAKLSEFFRTLLEDSMEKIDHPTAAAVKLRLQMEQARWRHQQEVDELKHNHELTLAEMRLSFEKDKLRVMSETRRAMQVELDAAVKLAKSKQWCANCNQEAQFYCCWNTAYCDYPCQRAHWPLHSQNCAQGSKDDDETSPPESRLQPQPDNLPALQKSVQPSAAPALTVGGKLATTRVFSTQDGGQQKTSIIVSMVEDNSGNQTMKCVGTYKPSQAQGQMPSLLLNKQVINEEAGKKVVTSGGYLIVGAGGNTASVITPAPSRRPHTIQYFT